MRSAIRYCLKLVLTYFISAIRCLLPLPYGLLMPTLTLGGPVKGGGCAGEAIVDMPDPRVVGMILRGSVP